MLGTWRVVSFAGGLCSHEIRAGTPMGMPLLRLLRVISYGRCWLCSGAVMSLDVLKECPVRACTHREHSAGLLGWCRIASMAGGDSAFLGPSITSGCFFSLYLSSQADPGERSSDCGERPTDHRESPVDSGKDYNLGSSQEGA